MPADVPCGVQNPAALKILLTDTTRGPLPSRLAISLSQAGFAVEALCPRPGHPLGKTRAVGRLYPYSGLRPLHSLRSAIRAAAPQLIIPCDDRSVQHLHELHGQARQQGEAGQALADLIETSLGPVASYATTTARYRLLELAREEGIPVPTTRSLSSVDDLLSWAECHPLPWVLKADGTFGGRGVKIAQTRAQAEACYRELTHHFSPRRAIKRWGVNRDSFWLRPCWRRVRPAITVQGYICGRPANCAVVCWQGTVLAGIAVEVMDVRVQTGPASVVRVVENRPMMLAAERLVARLGLSGLIGLDFIIESGTEVPYLIEMNPRSTPLCHLRLGPGRDMVGALWARLSGRSTPRVPAVTSKDLIAYFPQSQNSDPDLLHECFLDIPEGEPELVKELLRPWPERTFLFRMANRLQRASAPATPPPQSLPQPNSPAEIPESAAAAAQEKGVIAAATVSRRH